MNRPPLHVVFRCDASVRIGAGHVARCLTLADAIAAGGGRCDFVCRDLPGNLMAEIAMRGHAVQALDAPGGTLEPDPADPYAAWVGVSRELDARECRAIVDRLGPDRVVVDHYALDAAWTECAVPADMPVMVIDDLADRVQQCDVLLDQNLGRKPGDYVNLVPDTAIRLTGPRYALLRPEFASARTASLTRRQTPALRHLLIAMGGVDGEDATGQVLGALAAGPLPNGLRVTVALGSGAPFPDRVRARAAEAPFPVTVCIGTANMAALMADADLAIGGAGGACGSAAAWAFRHCC